MEGEKNDNRDKKCAGDISARKRAGRKGISGAGVYADRRSWSRENCIYPGICSRAWDHGTGQQSYIGDVEEMEEVGFEDYVMGEGVSLIEWANLIEEILPEKRTEITIEKNLEEGFDYRKITVEETI